MGADNREHPGGLRITLSEVVQGSRDEQTLYRWRRKYGGLDTSDVQRLKELATENARLKRLLAERDLEVDALKELLAKKW
jgi:transposase-like protein